MGKVREKKVKRVRKREREKRDVVECRYHTHAHPHTRADTHTDRQIDMKKHGHGHGTYDMVNRLRGVLLQACTYCTSLQCCTVLYWMWSRKCGLVSGSVVYRAV